MNSRKCEIRIVDVHRASYAKHLRSKKQLKMKSKMKLLYQNGYIKNLLKMKLKNYLILNH